MQFVHAENGFLRVHHLLHIVSLFHWTSLKLDSTSKIWQWWCTIHQTWQVSQQLYHWSDRSYLILLTCQQRLKHEIRSVATNETFNSLFNGKCQNSFLIMEWCKTGENTCENKYKWGYKYKLFNFLILPFFSWWQLRPQMTARHCLYHSKMWRFNKSDCFIIMWIVFYLCVILVILIWKQYLIYCC